MLPVNSGVLYFSLSQVGLFKEFYLSFLNKINSINSKIKSNKFGNQFLFSAKKKGDF